jgi:tryptophanyl-tRNA synthetase
VDFYKFNSLLRAYAIFCLQATGGTIRPLAKIKGVPSLSSTASAHARVVSGMRPTGKMHLGHYHGALKNWVKMQHEYECIFLVVDWHALTTHYEDPSLIKENVWDMVVEWLAVGIDPGAAKIALQSWVPEHAELHLLLSMMTPLGWLERVPTYKDQMQNLQGRDLATYGFLGYPLLQSADILIYKADKVPVGEDQASHVEMTREIARRFNHLYGREPDFIELSEKAIDKMGKKNAKRYRQLRKAFQEQGDHEALETAQALLEGQANITLGDKERLFGYLEGSGKLILPEPDEMLTETPKLLGLDGRKMSKSYHNTITLRDTDEEIEQKVRTMQTDPARVKRIDPGEPEKCPVWNLHKVYSDDDVKDWVVEGCRSAGIGCLDCKGPLIESIQAELRPVREAAVEYDNNPSLVRSIVAEGSQQARELARDTMDEVKEAMGLEH